MRVAVISDTHLHSPDHRVERWYEQHMAGADVLIHLGDMVGQDMADFFSQHPRCFFVRGNCDAGNWAMEVPITRSLTLDGCRVGAAHGWGPRTSVWKNVADYFGPGYDLILYGHTHKRDERLIPGGPMVVNPGSLLAPRDGLPGMAMVELEADTRPVITWVDVDL